MSNFWNKKFGQSDYLYGQGANPYIKEKLTSLLPGKILFPAEGEGRNSVYAATLGWEVFAFDQSEVGKEKAQKLAVQKGVEIDYQLATVEEVNYPSAFFDAIVLVYAHFPKEVRRRYHRKVIEYLKPGGHLILLGFSKDHRNYQKQNHKVGGPQDINMLFSAEDLKNDFGGFDFREVIEKKVNLSEGYGHVGQGKIIQLFATKK